MNTFWKIVSVLGAIGGLCFTINMIETLYRHLHWGAKSKRKRTPTCMDTGEHLFEQIKVFASDGVEIGGIYKYKCKACGKIELQHSPKT
jgi:hypothetical protein